MDYTNYEKYKLCTSAESVLQKTIYNNETYELTKFIDISDVRNRVADVSLILSKVHHNALMYDTTFYFDADSINLAAKVFYNSTYAVVRFPDDKYHFIYEVLFMRMKTGIVDKDEILLWTECARDTCRERNFLNFSIFHTNRVDFLNAHSDDYQSFTAGRSLKIDFTNLDMRLIDSTDSNNCADDDIDVIVIKIDDNFNVDAYKRFMKSDIITLTDVSRRQYAIDNVNKYMKLKGFIDDQNR